MKDGKAYYNEFDPFCVKWLQNLIDENLIAPGDVDSRDIRDVKPSDLKGYSQCHFFAGIGGWSYALRLAGWDDKRPVWTGSCPCQPFSTAGKGTGFTDERHLWPAWCHLISKSLPSVVFGEQVEAAIKHGWLNLVQNDLEGSGYAFGSVGLPAASVGAPHIRQRLWFVASRGVAQGNSQRTGLEGLPRQELSSKELTQRRTSGVGQADTVLSGWAEGRTKPGNGSVTGSSQSELVANSSSLRRIDASECRQAGGASDAPPREVQEQRIRTEPSADRGRKGVAQADTYDKGSQGRELRSVEGSSECAPRTPGPTNGFWGDAEWIACSDGKARPAKPGIFPLASGVPNRVGILRGAGNAIVPQVAAELIKAVMEDV